MLGGNPAISKLFVLINTCRSLIYIFLQRLIIKIEGIHRVTEGFSAKSREKELAGKKMPVKAPFWALNARIGTILGV